MPPPPQEPSASERSKNTRRAGTQSSAVGACTVSQVRATCFACGSWRGRVARGRRPLRLRRQGSPKNDASIGAQKHAGTRRKQGARRLQHHCHDRVSPDLGVEAPYHSSRQRAFLNCVVEPSCNELARQGDGAKDTPNEIMQPTDLRRSQSESSKDRQGWSGVSWSRSMADDSERQTR